MLAGATAPDASVCIGSAAFVQLGLNWRFSAERYYATASVPAGHESPPREGDITMRRVS